MSNKKMSNKKMMIEIVPPSHIGIPGGAVEKLHSIGHTCSCCHGSGCFWGSDDRGEDELQPCRVCGGSGKVDAIITIEWKKTEEARRMDAQCG
ncbi:MAG: hypothetical protein SPI30_08670 [Prevotella sp.]|nr:hypothetical protein [Prevotella sp.]